jgi:hypothetical protein
VGIPPFLRNFQAKWKSPTLGLFHGAASSTALFTHNFCYRAKYSNHRNMHLTCTWRVGQISTLSRNLLLLVPVPGNCIAPEADCKAKRTFAAEKPDDLLPSWTGPRHREASKLISPTPVPLPSFRHWDYAQRRLSASLPEAATAPSFATSRRTVCASDVHPPASISSTAHAYGVFRLYSPPCSQAPSPDRKPLSTTLLSEHFVRSRNISGALVWRGS